MCNNCQPNYEQAEVNLTRQYVIETQGKQGQPGPAGEVPTPIPSDDLFDI